MMRISIVARSVLLFILGSLMAFVLIRSDYWIFLHPKLRFFSLTASALILVSSLVSLIQSITPPKKWYGIVFLVCIGMFFIGIVGKTGDSAPVRSASEDMPFREDGAPEGSRFTFQGNEYVPINVGELFLMGKLDDKVLAEERFALRGIVKRQPKFDTENQILLTRLAVTCCLADATVLVYRVLVPDPEVFVDGEWIVVLGSVQKDAIGESEIPDKIIVEGIRYFTMETDRILVADTFRKIAPPDFSYMFQFKTEEPFAF
jgi:hypothetical protein